MTTLDLRSAPRDGAGNLIGQGIFSAPSRDGSRHVTFSREPTLEERIYTAVWKSGGALSRADIARALGRAKATWLNTRIEAMVSSGQLARRVGAHTNGFAMYFYEVPL